MHIRTLPKKVYSGLVILIGLYIFASFFTPVNQETLDAYNISSTQLRLITLPALLIVSGIWAATAYGFTHFKQYALIIKDSPDGKGINTLANGLGLVALQLVTTGIFSSVTAIKTVEDGLGGPGSILVISTILGLVLNLAAFYVLKKGAGQLVKLLKKPRPQTVIWLLLLGAISVFYLYLIEIGYPFPSATDSVYHHISLSAALLLVGLGNIICWYLALSAAFNLWYYQNHVQGIIYKSALRLLARGMYVIVGCSIIIQLLSTLNNSLEDLSLAPLLFVLYVLIAAIGLGFVFIAQSAKKLRKIEEL